MISQVNLYDTVLNESEITKGGKNCSINMPVGSVFRWQEFTSYISTETAGVNVIEPSLCGSDECPLSYEGEWCNTTEGNYNVMLCFVLIWYNFLFVLGMDSLLLSNLKEV